MEPDQNPLVPGDESGKNQDAQIHTKNDGGENRQQHPTKAHIETFIRAVSPAVRVFAFLALVEAIALFLQHFADVLHGVFVELANWVSLCLQLLIVAVLIAKLIESCGKTKKWVWIPYGFVCFVMLVAICVPTKNKLTNQILEPEIALRPRRKHGSKHSDCDRIYFGK